MGKKLFIPGPIDVRKEVLEKMSTPMIGHRGGDASTLQKSISEKLQKLFYTDSTILLSTSSGTGLMEGSIRCSTLKKAAIFSSGAFGDRWYKMAIANNVPADLFKVEDGKAIDIEMVEKVLSTGEYDVITITHNETSTGVRNPIEEIGDIIKKYDDIIYCVDAVSSAGGIKIEVDKIGIDICVTSVQKALGLPPGMSICTFSQRAIERAKQISHRGIYFDLLAMYEYILKKDYQYPSTPSLSHMFALDFQLDEILKEGLDNRFKRHEDMANLVRDWSRKHFEIFTDENHLSNTLTVIKNTKGINVSNLNKKLQERGYQIANGYGDLKEKTFRISHMGDYTLDDINELLDNIEDILGLLNKVY
ncbi:alanine--glyoxylate aminotransferase family protein [Romboutsia sedimentorum]|uniref:Alanine--glyoxylate aminotransferase family protein n=1 Tax=Romboutsia sedimentorum TaxID=1368474 RepID=A0ABT7E4T0_9FIRM|nr:alanine--glyoxylate aminotransferase family protein [Romboutsia sedimentorum]MDK2561931.1 alanine--glyoxylate aminotransferase family protein [Romboutsia sedimentorum]MDK2586725.1 alanine--glyoxylate aminotransferase family protein [Romboutsia sedimentorum]